MEKLGLNLGYLLVQIFNFAIILVVLRAWVYKPLMNMLKKRREAIAQGLEDARTAAEARANAERDAEKIIASAQAKAAEVVREATERAEAAAKEVRAAADLEIAKSREEARLEVEAERNRILGELRGQVGALAISATQKLVGEALDEQRQRLLLKEFFSGVKAGKVVVLEGADLGSGQTAEVVSALKLMPDEEEIVRKEVLGSLGETASVTFKQDPSILGGLVVRVGDRVIDGSVAGKLENLRRSLR
ncbi:MAG TPA: F0F1 ATP synthase subunit B [Anaerolineaceae bacterium]